MALNAFPRWLRADFSLPVSSAQVRPLSASMQIGSYPNPPALHGVKAIFPSHRASRICLMLGHLTLFSNAPSTSTSESLPEPFPDSGPDPQLEEPTSAMEHTKRAVRFSSGTSFISSSN